MVLLKIPTKELRVEQFSFVTFFSLLKKIYFLNSLYLLSIHNTFFGKINAVSHLLNTHEVCMNHRRTELRSGRGHTDPRRLHDDLEQ